MAKEEEEDGKRVNLSEHAPELGSAKMTLGR